MKKVLLVVFAWLSLCMAIYASDPYYGQAVPLTCERVKHGASAGHMPRNPIDPPSVSYDGYTLYINSSHPDCTVQLVDEEDIVVYEVFVDADTNVIIFPSTLTGEYRLNLLWDDWCFWGYIAL